MQLERVVELLRDSGMSGYEAKAYLALLTAGRPLNGYEVAKASGVPRSTVYETLAKLVAQGASFEVRFTSADPSAIHCSAAGSTRSVADGPTRG